MSPTHRTVTLLRRGDTPPALATEGAGFTDATVAAALAAGILPIETGSVDGPAAAWIVDPADALAIVGRGVGAWRVTVRHTGRDEDVLDALARTEAPVPANHA